MAGTAGTAPAPRVIGSVWTKEMAPAMTTISAAMARNGSRTSAAYRKAPTTGPMMMPASKATALRAISQGSRSASTRSAGSDRPAGALKARATPETSTRAKMGRIEVGPVPAYQPSPRATTAWTRAEAATIRRRSTRSATVPLTSTSSAAGANSTRPSRPRSSSLPVRSNTSLPRMVAWAMAAAAPTKSAVNSAPIDRRTRVGVTLRSARPPTWG